MLSFFSKKAFLMDQFEGFVDIHNHLLPGIDDGAETVTDSLAMIKGFGEIGIEHFVCTPHIMHNYHDNTPETITSAFEVLQAALRQHAMDSVHLDFAAEHMIDDNFENLLATTSVVPLRKYYLLIEMSFLQPPLNFKSAVSAIIDKKLFPILAHPERYQFLGGKTVKFKSYKDLGLLFQSNILSVAGYYGSEVQKTAFELIKANLIDFFGSDVHSMRQLNFLKEAQLEPKKIQLLRPIIERTIENFRN
ncbi:CpsB/CapC family capsule biosynthesis tyrosine phosphatase [Flagellimonas sp. DF-77]|uniref:tyrosine-protein phosphatase n=1 Tax=Flagellimonas algarum TaxID=3230298 RepID=UPI003391AB4D